MQPLEIASLRLRTPIHPRFFHNVHAGIKNYLSALLFTYSTKLEGTPLAFSDIRVLKDIVVGPYLVADVACKAVLFCPRRGMILEGVVSKVAKGHLSLLVLGTFKGSILFRDEPECVSYSITEQDSELGETERVATFVSGGNECVLEAGSPVRFMVLRSGNYRGITHIEGSLGHPGCGAADTLEAGSAAVKIEAASAGTGRADVLQTNSHSCAESQSAQVELVEELKSAPEDEVKSSVSNSALDRKTKKDERKRKRERKREKRIQKAAKKKSNIKLEKNSKEEGKREKKRKKVA